jgi:hypothetical protein
MNDKQSRDAMARQEKIVCAFFISILLVFMNAAYADCRSAWLRVINTSLAHTHDFRSFLLATSVPKLFGEKGSQILGFGNYRRGKSRMNSGRVRYQILTWTKKYGPRK